jgi:hypothetical protein
MMKSKKSTLSFYKRDKTWTFHLAWYENDKRKQKKVGGFLTKGAAILGAEKEERKLATMG